MRIGKTCVSIEDQKKGHSPIYSEGVLRKELGVSGRYCKGPKDTEKEYRK